MKYPLSVLVLTALTSSLFPVVAQNSLEPVVTIRALNPQTSEGGGNAAAAFAVRRTGPTNFPLAVFYTLSGTASNGVDYEHLGTSVQIAAGTLEANFRVTPIDDTLVEGSETVVAQLAGSPLLCITCGYSIGEPSKAEVVIADNDSDTAVQATVDIVATDDTGTEIPIVPPWLDLVQRSDPAIFTVTRTGPTNFPMTVYYSVGGTASNGVDYAHLPGSVVIPTGAASATIEVWVDDDLFVEGTETVELTLQPPICIQIFPPPPECYLVGSHSRAMASILDNDEKTTPVVTIVATDPEASEVGPDTGTFTVRRTGDTTEPLAVFYRIGGTAQIGVDYLSFSNHAAFPGLVDMPDVQIPAGSASVELRVYPLADKVTEGSETVRLTLEQPEWAGYLVGEPASAVVDILDAGGVETNHAPTVQMIAPHAGEQFAAPANIQLIALAQDAEDSYFVEVEFFEGTHSLGFGTFNPSRCAVCPNYILIWSNVPPGDYALRAAATDHQGATTLSDFVRIRVTETNVPPNTPVVTVLATDALAVEGPFCRSNWWWTTAWDGNDWTVAPAIGDLNSLGWRTNGCAGPNTATFVVRRHGPTNASLTVSYALGGTATAGSDYVSLPGQITIPAGRYAAPVEIIPIEDSLSEHIETVLLRLLPAATSPSGVTSEYTLGTPAHAAAIIVDNDRPRPPCMRLPDGMFHVCRPATNGYNFRLRASDDLVHWRVLCTNTVTDGAMHFVDPDAADSSTRFYQMLTEP